MSSKDVLRRIWNVLKTSQDICVLPDLKKFIIVRYTNILILKKKVFKISSFSKNEFSTKLNINFRKLLIFNICLHLKFKEKNIYLAILELY